MKYGIALSLRPQISSHSWAFTRLRISSRCTCNGEFLRWSKQKSGNCRKWRWTSIQSTCKHQGSIADVECSAWNGVLLLHVASAEPSSLAKEIPYKLLPATIPLIPLNRCLRQRFIIRTNLRHRGKFFLSLCLCTEYNHPTLVAHHWKGRHNNDDCGAMVYRGSSRVALEKRCEQK